VLGLETRRPGDRENPIENARKHHQIISRISQSQSRDGRPSEKSGRRDREASKEQPFQGLDHAGVLDLDPLELQREPYPDQERRLGAKQEGQESERCRGEREGRGEEEGELGSDQREPDREKGGRLQAEGIENVGDHQAEGQRRDHRGAAEIEEEGGGGDQGEGDAAVV